MAQFLESPTCHKTRCAVKNITGFEPCHAKNSVTYLFCLFLNWHWKWHWKVVFKAHKNNKRIKKKKKFIRYSVVKLLGIYKYFFLLFFSTFTFFAQCSKTAELFAYSLCTLGLNAVVGLRCDASFADSRYFQLILFLSFRLFFLSVHWSIRRLALDKKSTSMINLNSYNVSH